MYLQQHLCPVIFIVQTLKYRKKQNKTEAGSRGLLLGDTSLKTVGVKIEPQGGELNPRFIDGVFRICTSLNYRFCF